MLLSLKYFSNKLILQKLLQYRLFNFFIFKKKSKLLFALNCLISIFVFEIVYADSNFIKTKKNQVSIEYLDSRNELEDYIIDTGDSIFLEFFPANELSGKFTVNEEGELILPRLNETFVRGLTKSELTTLLEKRYAQFLINPKIRVFIAEFKSIRVLARGELRDPGFYEFAPYETLSNITLSKKNNNEQFEIRENLKLNNQAPKDLIVKRASNNLTTISDVIRKAGGITSLTDLSRIEIIRDVPLGKGGGKKKAIIDLNGYVNKSDPTNNIRIFDGDSLFFPKLSKSNSSQISKSILSGLSPKFISVNLYGRVETPGLLKLPLEASLSDAIDLSGPIKPLSGKIVLIRYEKDGNFLKKNISYAANAKRGTKRNPYLEEGDLISVKASIFGKTTAYLKEITAPFIGIYTTKELIDNFSD